MKSYGITRPRVTVRAFTLIELLVVITVIVVLAALVVSVSKAAISNARRVSEVNAARNLMSAYSLAAGERSGQFLPGYDRTVSSITLPDGTPVTGPAAERYPYRLAPYFNYAMNGTILVNANAAQIDASSTYLVSCYPAFGINYIFVGGDIAADSTMTYPGECATTQGSANGSLLVFATAVGSGTASGSPSGTNAQINGYCILTPPNLTTTMWSPNKWSGTSSPSDYGNVDARYNGKAIAGFLDGSVRVLTIDELRDMRLWSTNAAQQGNSNYMVQQTSRGGRL